MRSVELFVILAVTAFDLAVVPGGVRTDELVSNSQFLQRLFKKGLASGIGEVQAVGKFGAVICLNAFNGEGKLLDHMAMEAEKMRKEIRRASDELLDCIRDGYTTRKGWNTARKYIHSLMSGAERKNGW